MSEMTIGRFQILKLIDELCDKTEYKLASTKDLIELISTERNIKKQSVRVGLSICKKMGLLENPIQGGWRLTEKGKDVLENIK